MTARILVVNPGSTSTKVGVFHGDECRFVEEIVHSKAELAGFERVADQLDYRCGAVLAALKEYPEGNGPFDAVAGRGGILQSLPGGTYHVSRKMIEVLAACRYGEHPCNLGAPLANRFAEKHGIPAFIVDPPVTDEMLPVSRVTGLPEISRRSVFHALNQRAAARTAAARLGISYKEGAFVVAHMGGGISIGAHLRGRVADVINALDGEGPMSPERSGRLPIMPVLQLLENGRSIEDLKKDILIRGGVFAHLGTNDFREAARRAEAGDEKAEAVFSAVVYSIAREIGSMIPGLMLEGPRDIDAVVLTGGLARSERLCARIEMLIGPVARVVVVPGEMELAALAAGAIRGLNGEAEEYVAEPSDVGV